MSSKVRWEHTFDGNDEKRSKRTRLLDTIVIFVSFHSQNTDRIWHYFQEQSRNPYVFVKIIVNNTPTVNTKYPSENGVYRTIRDRQLQ